MLFGEFKVVQHRHLGLYLPGVDQQTVKSVDRQRADRFTSTSFVFLPGRFTDEQDSNVRRILDDFYGMRNLYTPCSFSPAKKSNGPFL